MAYGTALCVGTTVALSLPATMALWQRVAAADLAGTVAVFGFSLALDNSSVYDAYWSVAPAVIALMVVLASPGALGNYRTQPQRAVATLVETLDPPSAVGVTAALGATQPDTVIALENSIVVRLAVEVFVAVVGQSAPFAAAPRRAR